MRTSTDCVKDKGIITSVGAANDASATINVNLYDRLFTNEQPDAGGNGFLSTLDTLLIHQHN